MEEVATATPVFSLFVKASGPAKCPKVPSVYILMESVLCVQTKIRTTSLDTNNLLFPYLGAILLQ